jgi:hypothetical protein
MSTGGLPPHDAAVLNQQVENVIRDSEALNSAVARGRFIRVILLIALIGVIAYGAITLKRPYDKYVTDEGYQQKFLAAITDHIADNQRNYQQEFDHFVNEVGPVVRDTFTAQAKKDMPKFLETLERQRDEMSNNLQTKLEEKIIGHYDAMLKKQQSVLTSALPEMNDAAAAERLEKNLETAMHRLIKRYYVDKMHEQIVGMLQQWDTFPTVPPASGGETLEDQLVGTLYDLLLYRLSHSSALAHGT